MPFRFIRFRLLQVPVASVTAGLVARLRVRSRGRTGYEVPLTSTGRWTVNAAVRFLSAYAKGIGQTMGKHPRQYVRRRGEVDGVFTAICWGVASTHM